MDADEIIKALHEECEDCSEKSFCDRGKPIIYCPVRDAAKKIQELNDFQNSQCVKLFAIIAQYRVKVAVLEGLLFQYNAGGCAGCAHERAETLEPCYTCRRNPHRLAQHEDSYKPKRKPPKED